MSNKDNDKHERHDELNHKAKIVKFNELVLKLLESVQSKLTDEKLNRNKLSVGDKIKGELCSVPSWEV